MTEKRLPPPSTQLVEEILDALNDIADSLRILAGREPAIRDESPAEPVADEPIDEIPW